MKNLLIIARLTFHETIRRKIVLISVILGLAFLLVFNLGCHFILSESTTTNLITNNEVINFLTTSGLYGVNFLAIVLAALVSADTLAGEIRSGVIQSIAARPIRRWQIVLGKWLGFAVPLGVYLFVMGGGIILSVLIQSGYLIPNPFLGLLYMYFASLVIMTVTLAFSSTLSTLATGGAVFGLYSIAIVGGWVEQFGGFLDSQTAVDIGIITSLIMPAEALWRRATFEMTSPLLKALSVITPLVPQSPPSTLMVAYAGLYLLVVFFIAIHRFGQRDL